MAATASSDVGALTVLLAKFPFKADYLGIRPVERQQFAKLFLSGRERLKRCGKPIHSDTCLQKSGVAPICLTRDLAAGVW